MVIVFMFAWNEFLLASILTSREAKTLPVIVPGVRITSDSMDWTRPPGIGRLLEFGLRLLISAASVRV